MLDHDNHRKYMYQIVDAIFTSPLRQNLAFKGGTLCYFLHGLPRFSTDLDFDVVLDSEDIVPAMESLLSPLGNIKDKHSKTYTYFLLFDYGTGEHNIKIEMSNRKYMSNTYETINFFGRDITAMAKDSIFANKLVALSERWKNRDLFDVYFFFTSKFPINERLIKERTGLSLKDFLLTLKKELPKKYAPNTILAEIGDLISQKQKHFMKTHLVSEVQKLIDFALFELDHPMR